MHIVLAADLHIDSPLRGVSRLDGAAASLLPDATRGAFTGLIDHCLDTRPDLLLLAGDLFDGDWRDWNTGLFFVRQLHRLAEVGTQVVAVLGNHDAEGQMSRRLPWPAHATLLPSDAATTWVDEGLGVAVHGQSYATRDVTDNLALAYPRPRRGLFNVGLLHTAASGARGESGHARYAPCTVGQLVDHGYDLWALGHVHERQVLHEGPWIAYPGNLQGRHAREPGPRGVLEWTGDALRPLDLDVVRWARLAVDVTGRADPDDVLDAVRTAGAELRDAADGRPQVVRVELCGSTAAHHALHADPAALRAGVEIALLGAGEPTLEKVVLTTRPAGEPASELLAALEAELATLAMAGGGALDDVVPTARRILEADPWSDESVAAARDEALALLRLRLGEGAA